MLVSFVGFWGVLVLGANYRQNKYNEIMGTTGHCRKRFYCKDQVRGCQFVCIHIPRAVPYEKLVCYQHEPGSGPDLGT